MAIISLGNINKYFIFALLGGISKSVAETFLYIYKNELKKYPFMLGANAGFGMSLSILPYIYAKIKYQGINDQSIVAIEKLVYDKKYYKVYNQKSLRLKKFLIILLCGFLDFFQKVLVFLFSYSIDNNIWIFNILFLNVFSICILKTKLYKHQLISSSIMIAMGIILNIIILFGMPANKIPALLLSIFIETIYSLCIVVSKYGMEHGFCSPLEISFYEGVFAFVINVIFLSIATNVPISKNSSFIRYLKSTIYKEKIYLDNFFAYFDEFRGKEIIMFIITMLSRWIFNLFTLIALKHYTPSHVIFLLIIGETQNAFFDIDLTWKRIVAIVIYCFLLILLLIFTEIIILNFWGLDKDTRDKIAFRAKFIESGDLTDYIEEDSSERRKSDTEIEIEKGIQINLTKTGDEKLLPDI